MSLDDKKQLRSCNEEETKQDLCQNKISKILNAEKEELLSKLRYEVERMKEKSILLKKGARLLAELINKRKKLHDATDIRQSEINLKTLSKQRKDHVPHNMKNMADTKMELFKE
ncbi:hypothetical protein Tco_1098622 [Tanacetum coccineum]